MQSPEQNKPSSYLMSGVSHCRLHPSQQFCFGLCVLCLVECGFQVPCLSLLSAATKFPVCAAFINVNHKGSGLRVQQMSYMLLVMCRHKARVSGTVSSVPLMEIFCFF